MPFLRTLGNMIAMLFGVAGVIYVALGFLNPQGMNHPTLATLAMVFIGCETCAVFMALFCSIEESLDQIRINTTPPEIRLAPPGF